MPKLKAGDKAPSFSLKHEKERDVSLEAFAGKWIILYFYPKDNTPGCTTEAIEFTGELDEFGKLNTVVLGVSRDLAESHRKFICKQDLKITLLTDANHKVMDDYGVWQVKKMYGKESMGIVRSTFIIDSEGKIAHMWYKVKVKNHVEEVKKMLETLQS